MRVGWENSRQLCSLENVHFNICIRVCRYGREKVFYCSKAFRYIASPSIRIPSIVSVVHIKISHELAHNKAEKLIIAHRLPLEISLKRWLPWWILPRAKRVESRAKRVEFNMINFHLPFPNASRNREINHVLNRAIIAPATDYRWWRMILRHCRR